MHRLQRPITARSRVRVYLVFAVFLFDLLAMNAFAHADSPPGDSKFMERLCAPNPVYTLREGRVITPILLYHLVGRRRLERNGRSLSPFNVTEADFEAQLQLLQQLGYQSVTLSEIAAALEGRISLPERSIALTFDDGWQEQYAVAFPLLQRYGMRATFFVVASYIGYPRFMSWEQLAELRDAGMEIASHGHRHINLAEADDDTARQEIVRSKRILEEKLGITVISFAYPYGGYRKELPAMLRQAGYQIAVGVGGSFVYGTERRYYLPRIQIRGQDSLLGFLDRLPWRGVGTALCPSG